MPIYPGNTWIYQNEARAERWKTEETVTKLMTVPEGMIVVRRIRVIKGKPSVAPPKEQAWLLHGDCLYDLTAGDWDARRPDQLSAAFSARPPWNGGEHVRVFCFPLSDGKTWGKESGHGWRVADVNNQDPSSPDKGKTFHVSSNVGSGLAPEFKEDVWFERGVGIVEENDVHAGTNGAGSNEEARTQLLYFEPAPAAALGKAPAPLGEVGLDYANNSLAISTSGYSSQNGGSAYGQYFLKGTAQKWNIRSMFGVVANFSGSAGNSGSLYTYMFGPRLNIEWRRAHLFYYFEPMIGASHVQVNGTNLAGSAATAARSSFAYGESYGFGFLSGEHCVVTLFRIDTVVQEVPDVASGTSRWRGDSRIAAGIGFRFGLR